MDSKKRYTFAILFGITMLAFSEQMVTVLINDITNQFSLKGAQIGLSGTCMSAGCTLAMLVVPLLAGRFKKLTSIKASIVVICLSLFLGQLMPVFFPFLVMILIMGLGSGSLDTLCNGAMVDLHKTDNAKYLGALHGVYGIGALIAPLVLRALLEGTKNWKMVFIIMAIVFAVVFAIFMIFVPNKGITESAKDADPEEQKLSWAMLKEFYSDKRNIIMTIVAVCYSFFQCSMLSWSVRYMTVQHDNAKAGSFALTAFWLGATVSRFFGPRLKVQKMKLVGGGCVIGAAALLIGILSNSPYGMIAAYAVVGLASGFAMPMIISAATDGQEGRTSLATSSIMFILAIPRMITPVLVAAIAAGISQNAAMTFGVIAATLCGVISFIVAKK